MSALSSRGRRRLMFVAAGIASAGLVVASAAWALVPQGPTLSSTDAASTKTPGAAGTSGRGRRVTVTITPSRPADAAGWYRNPVTFTTTGVDSRGGVVTCSAPQTYSGPDVSHIAIVGTCTDAGGKTQSSSTFDLRYDATAPVVTVDAGRPVDHNGWFNSPVTFSTHGSDALSGLVGCSVPGTYLAPDTTAGTQRGSCTDGAGNTGSALAQFKFDATAPTVTAALARTADHGGWYNHPVDTAFTGTDATSGCVSCAVASYSGPDSATASVSSSCSDAAGNSASASVPFAYDATAPTAATTLGRGPDYGPWFNHAVSVSFSGSDTVSTGVTCDPAASYSGPDSATASVIGTCTDAAGNTGSATQSFAYDGTAPSVTAALARTADHGGWYNHAVDTAFTGTDATSGGVSCAVASYSGPDSATATVSSSCSDAAGNSASASVPFAYDATAPTAATTLGRAPDSGPWFNHAVSVSFSGSDTVSTGVTCDPAASYSGPDSATASVTGTCTDAAGNTGSATQSFAYDGTAPSVTAALARTADHGGWYNHAVDTAFTGTDATSGGVSCAVASYSGPDSATATVSSSCSDAAGNSASASVPFAYDATAPTAATTLGRGPDYGPWFNHAVSVSFSGSDTVSTGVTCDPAASYSGPDSATASVTGTCTDAAGNTGSATQSFAYDGTAPSVTAALARTADHG